MAEFAEVSRARVREWSKEDHLNLLAHFLSDATAEVPKNEILHAIGVDIANERGLADLLAQRFTSASSNTLREAVVELWEQSSITDSIARRKLFESVIYGLLALHLDGGGNAGAVGLALKALERVGNPLPHGVKRELGGRLRRAVQGNNAFDARTARVLQSLGYRVTTSLFGNRRIEEDPPDQ